MIISWDIPIEKFEEKEPESNRKGMKKNIEIPMIATLPTPAPLTRRQRKAVKDYKGRPLVYVPKK